MLNNTKKMIDKYTLKGIEDFMEIFRMTEEKLIESEKHRQAEDIRASKAAKQLYSYNVIKIQESKNE